MDFLGIGPLELLLVLIIVILVFGPEDLAKAGKTIGRFLNKFIRSDGWRAIRDVNREMRDLPNRLVKEAELEDSMKELADLPKQIENELAEDLGETKEELSSTQIGLEEGIKAWTTPPETSTEPTQSSVLSED